MARTALRVDRETLLLLFAQWLLFAGNFVAYWKYPLAIWAHVLIGIIPLHLAFTIWHEATHGSVSNRRWLNTAVGILGMFPYTTPYFMQRYVHLDHHKYLNVPEKDPNELYKNGAFVRLPLRYFRTIAFARRWLAEDPRSRAMIRSDRFFIFAVLAIYAYAAWKGFFVDLLLIWFVPVIIGKILMDFYVNYLPHVGLPPDRFLGTRIIDVRWMTPLFLKHNYHAVHHLWPNIPWHRYPEEFRKRKDYLVANGVPIESSFFGGRLYPALAAASPTAAPRDDVQQQNA